MYLNVLYSHCISISVLGGCTGIGMRHEPGHENGLKVAGQHVVAVEWHADKQFASDQLAGPLVAR